uniref:Uncharacterized protein n=1 Tax=Neolamprologus brichardi TaxID=32507 RepID=A0A3Q4HTR2_NEOBR
RKIDKQHSGASEFLEAISKQLQIARSPVQTTVCHEKKLIRINIYIVDSEARFKSPLTVRVSQPGQKPLLQNRHSQASVKLQPPTSISQIRKRKIEQFQLQEVCLED